jgi:hypothetical protein
MMGSKSDDFKTFHLLPCCGGVKERSMYAKKVGLMVAAFVLGGVSSLPTYAASAGEVVNLSGTLSAQRPDGALLVLSQKSEVRPGDTLSTQRDSYAQINFSDGSSMTMRPNTQMKVETYQFAQDKPQEDGAFFRLIKGGLRTVTGLVGKRGNQDAYRIGTATATIGIRGSTGDTLACETDCAGVINGGEQLPPGTYHQTLSGSYIVELGPNIERFGSPTPGAPTRVQLVNEGESLFTNGQTFNKGQGDIGSLMGILVNMNLPPPRLTGGTANFCRG